jgi:hypothetical protein
VKGRDVVHVYFSTDEAMAPRRGRERNCPGVASVRSRTTAENYARCEEIFADEPELLETASEDAMPAAIEVRPDDVDTVHLGEVLTNEFPRADVQPIPCR